MNISLASLNASWLGDVGMPNPFASEKHLYAYQPGRTYFNNTITNAIHYWQNVPGAAAIGFQEMNNRDVVREQPNMGAFVGGTNDIVDRFRVIDPTVAFEEFFVTVNHPNIVPGLLTIWKQEIFGDRLSSYGSDLDFFNGPAQQKGRPILIVLTKNNFNNYILINLHGPNFPIQSQPENNMALLRAEIQRHLNLAMEKFRVEGVDVANIPASNIFIMGDFNDPYNSIHPDRPLILNGEPYCYSNLQGEAGNSVKSCCYNFNSSCQNELFGNNFDPANQAHQELLEFPIDPTLGDVAVINPYECMVVNNPGNAYRKQGPGVGPSINTRSLGQRGRLDNYKFTGDYVLGLMQNIVIPLAIYRSHNVPDSQESDHEMVYATFMIPDPNKQIGIKRKRGGRGKKRKTIKSNKSNKLTRKRYTKKRKSK